ncbi:MAG: hypothetical protein ABI723_24290 [Bacteroidia bacterium]
MATKDVCFVVMPFGIKKFNDGTERVYDFDKVYRVIIQKAVLDAGLTPLRADETKGSRMVHTDMFKDLRDQPMVLIDLSLNNPNVYYEMGVRHVMSSHGTVLICRKGTTLPFDIALSRVIFYDFDGANLDWEESEKVKSQITECLRDSLKGQLDSPVHGLLEVVMRQEKTDSSNDYTYSQYDNKRLDYYQQKIAELWEEKGRDVKDLIEKHSRNIFGLRALGYFFIHRTDDFSDEQLDIAGKLSDMQQYVLANQIYDRFSKAGKLTSYKHVLRFASSFNEAHLESDNAKTALDKIDEAINLVKKKFEEEGKDMDKDMDYAESLATCYRRKAGVYKSIWERFGKDEDLDNLLEAYKTAFKQMQKARALGSGKFIGLIAQFRLMLLLLLRLKDNDKDRVDVEDHAKSILNLVPNENDETKGKSFLNWYQAIIYADSNAESTLKKKCIENYGEDSAIRNHDGNEDIGGTQYTELKKFLEQYSSYLRNDRLIGSISQVLSIKRKE